MLYIFPFLGKFPQYLMLTISKYGLEWTGVDCPTKMWVDLTEVHMELGGDCKDLQATFKQL